MGDYKVIKNVNIEDTIFYYPCIKCKSDDIVFGDYGYSTFNISYGKCKKCGNSVTKNCGINSNIESIIELWNKENGKIFLIRKYLTEISKLQKLIDDLTDDDDEISAGICDNCSIPKMMNSGDGINEPLDPILFCHKKYREICPELPEDRVKECEFFNCIKLR